MPDYGHALEFGTFITPLNADPEAPVLLAELSERLGFELVTFQDHPYQPRFHDTWTLLAFVAARTSRVHLAGDVLNLPLRQPGVLARASVSLDLLSGGRFELGLGAGGFWDAIEAMGGRRLTPGQAVDALEQAIDVIRDVWSTEPGGARAGGSHHRVEGAKRGPAAAHPIPIWIGALKPRMLRLIGRKGDGWLPSLGRIGEGGYGGGNAIIDAAALEAGRDPRSIRRLVNIGGDEPIELLERLALEDGVATFIVTGDEPYAQERFAHEVAPELRARVAAER